MSVPTLVRIAAPACAAVLLTGCGGTTVDHTTLEKAIEVSVAQQRHQIVIVSCPKGIEAKKGVKFRCLATTAAGQQYPFSVTGEDSKGNVRYVGLKAIPKP